MLQRGSQPGRPLNPREGVSMTSKRWNAPYFMDSVGRRRKLSDSAMKAICREYRDGETVRELAESYGVSTSLIRSVVYWTPRAKDEPKIELSEDQG
ncbi:hypothetical protein SALGADO_81 [Arthrobacter phage Salgado]|uniref:HTH DNA binding domain protein n=2 Tax=Laroyevirus TaxID=1982086 RepID=A0A0U4IXP5_9CAUD|nr:HTH DNA binding domain protein [Arthrobacter phage Laroye]YP_010082690.1 HTH DNA binding domain protein [Arthrobacter phage Salgado]ALY09606.1 hypothetical protein LAROYE_81 [Arthrobacter phage Laroye]ALY10247.1 hypothetical protein SALGADO_81 [Arthrobacter phage Salgado]